MPLRMYTNTDSRRSSRRAAPPVPCRDGNQSPDSGISGISEISINSVDHDTSDVGKPFNSTRLNEDSPTIKDYSMSSQMSSTSLASSEISTGRVTTQIPAIRLNDDKQHQQQPPKPPVRRESMRSDPRHRTSISLEQRFQSRFHPPSSFPAPPPYENCPKTYPTKELFSSPRVDQGRTEVRRPQEVLKTRSSSPFPRHQSSRHIMIREASPAFREDDSNTARKHKSRRSLDSGSVFFSKILTLKSSLSPSFGRQQSCPQGAR